MGRLPTTCPNLTRFSYNAPHPVIRTSIRSHNKMRIRKPFAAAFVAVILISAAAGFSPPDYKIPTYKQSDKVLHFVAFFALTVAFYWVVETSRRKVLQLTF